MTHIRPHGWKVLDASSGREAPGREAVLLGAMLNSR